MGVEAQQKKGGRVPGVPDSAPGVLWCQCFPSATPGCLCRDQKDAALGSQLKLAEARVLDSTAVGRVAVVWPVEATFAPRWRRAAGFRHSTAPPASAVSS